MNTQPVTYPPAPKELNAWCIVAPVINTAHFTESEASLLHNGHAILNDNHQDGRTCLLLIEDIQQCTDATRRVIQHFIDLGYRYLRLDPDGEKVAGLPTFDW